MKSHSVLLALGLLAASSLPALAQGGPLTPPPGVPVPTMKSLDQVEPSRPLVAGAPGVTIAPSGTITIAEPGAWHLVDNLSVTSGNGINITSNDVTLDLRGFTIASTGSDGIGINISGRTRVSILNGHIRSGTTFTAPSTFTPAGFTGGIDYTGGTPGIIRVADVSIEGTQNYGIDLGTNLAGVVESCVVRTTSLTGIRAAVVSNSIAIVIGQIPITADVAHNCVGRKIDGSAFNSTDEKRIPITTAPITISTPGSYYLTQNLTVTSGNAITITTGGVTLDLNGFAISSSASPAGGTAILLQKGGDLTDAVTLRNGHIRRANPALGSTGFDTGISTILGNFGLLISGIHVSDCTTGILASEESTVSTVVENCTVHRTSTGITAHTVRNCVVEAASNTAILGKTVENSIGRSTGFHGILAETVNNSIGVGVGASSNGITASVVRGSTGSGGSIGISAAVVAESTGETVSGTAISGRQISNCFAKATTGTGINTTGTASFCRIEVNSGAVAITGLHAYACTVSAGGLNNATQKNFCY